ncbi:PqqD family protein [Actinomadura sp. KC345]|uniref:PqqD family protein n=1 Tax=Actinomadura sp. KC345 TaxID=2530371 RepID=UPI00104B1344|nr:PqqD family protein [Actinomadura sp. KC345]TDC44694.1 PqqD family protein [Actinomadura sp. KC345]
MTVYAPAGGVECNDLGEQMLLTTPSGKYLVLEGTAVVLWRLIDGSRTLDDLAAACGREYEGDPAQIRRDLAEVLDDWAGRGLVTAAA